jgi:hypothetical protein
MKKGRTKKRGPQVPKRDNIQKQDAKHHSTSSIQHFVWTCVFVPQAHLLVHVERLCQFVEHGFAHRILKNWLFIYCFACFAILHQIWTHELFEES